MITETKEFVCLLTWIHLRFSAPIKPAPIQVTPARSWAKPRTGFLPSLSRIKMQTKWAGIYMKRILVWESQQTFDYLYKDCQAVIEIKVRSESWGSRGKSIVAHCCHHPVEKHYWGSTKSYLWNHWVINGLSPDKNCWRPEKIKNCCRFYDFWVILF